MRVDIIFNVVYNISVIYLLIGFRVSIKKITDNTKKRKTILLNTLTSVYIAQLMLRLDVFIPLPSNIINILDITYALLYIVVFILVLVIQNPFSIKSKQIH